MPGAGLFDGARGVCPPAPSQHGLCCLHPRPIPQLAVYGKESMRRMATANVLICGLGGLGVEVGEWSGRRLGVRLPGSGCRGCRGCRAHETCSCAHDEVCLSSWPLSSAAGRPRPEGCVSKREAAAAGVAAVTSLVHHLRTLSPPCLACLPARLCSQERDPGGRKVHHTARPRRGAAWQCLLEKCLAGLAGWLAAVCISGLDADAVARCP